MRNHSRSPFAVRLALSVAISAFADAASAGQAPVPRPPANAPPTLTLSSTCGDTITAGQTCTIALSASDQDGNLARIELNWNDGTPGETRVVTGGQAAVTFSRTFSTPRVVRWAAIAVDAAGVASSQLRGIVTVAAAPAPTPAQPPVAPSDAPPSAATEQQVAPLVVMLRGTLAESPFVAAGVIVGVASDRLYIATANHVVRGERPVGGEAAIAKDLQVQLRWLRGEWQRAQVLEESFDEALDLAVITVPGASQLAVPKLPWASFVKSDGLGDGESVLPMGYAAGNPWFMPRQSHVISSVGPQVIKTEGDLAPGYSGGALVTKDWGIAGIILNIAAVQNNVLRIDVALQRIREWGHEVDASFKERPKASDPSSDPAAALARDRQEAESFVGRWIAATLSRDTPALLNMAEMPFYFDQEILVRREDLESRLRAAEARPASELAGWKIQSIRAITVGELRARGEQANRDRVLGSLSMTDSDWHVSVVMARTLGSGNTEGAVFFVRKIGGVMKMVGLWD